MHADLLGQALQCLPARQTSQQAWASCSADILHVHITAKQAACLRPLSLAHAYATLVHCPLIVASACSALQGKYPSSLGELLKNTHTTAKRAAIMQQLSLKLAPIMEKGMVDAIIVHRCLSCPVQPALACFANAAGSAGVRKAEAEFGCIACKNAACSS